MRSIKARTTAVVTVMVTTLTFTIQHLAHPVLAVSKPSADRIAVEYAFSDVTKKETIRRQHIRTFGSTLVDHDSDGDPDLMINRHWNRAFVYENQGHFVLTENDLVDPPGYHSDDEGWVDRHGCAWGEANGDGRPDLFCTQGANHGTSTGPNQLLSWKGSALVDRARRFDVADKYGRGRSGNWLDHDSDGDLDLLVTNAVRDGHPTTLFRNDRGRFTRVNSGIRPAKSNWPTTTWADWDSDGDPDVLSLEPAGARAYENVGGEFKRVSIPLVDGGKWKGAAWGDYDGDGWIDLNLVKRDQSITLHNIRGTFTQSHEIPLSLGRMSVWLDLENDGDLDLYIVQGTPGMPQDDDVNIEDFLVVQERGFRVIRNETIRGRLLGNGDSVSASDYDRDGRTDVFVTNGHNPSKWTGPSQLLRNRSRAGNWVALDMVGTEWNPWGLGARIHVVTPGSSYWRHVTDGFNYRAQSEVGHIVLGLGLEQRALVRVTWPDGTIDCLMLSAGTTTSVRIGESPC